MIGTGRLALDFHLMVRNLFERLGFDIADSEDIDAGFDFTASGHHLLWVVEVKHYRSQVPHAGLLEAAAVRLANAAKAVPDGKPMLVVSSFVPHALRWRLDQTHAVAVNDRIDLTASALKAGYGRLAAFLSTGSQADPIASESQTEILPEPEARSFPVDAEGSQLASELRTLPAGNKTWRAYEEFAAKALKYLFADDLHGWHRQKRTDDRLNRFDLVCRVTASTEFWRFLSEQLRSRYIVFEFKNYNRKFTQREVLTTEKYLLENALRRVALILSRQGGDEGARLTSQGAMRQHGKLILILDDAMLVEMLLSKERGDDPTDRLLELSDDFLLSLPR